MTMNQAEFDSLVPSRPWTRRDFVHSTVGSGFAAAVLPVSAQTITTNTDWLEAGLVEIMVGSHKVVAYRAKPAGKINLPVILVVSEIFGVHEHIADVARRFAHEGYLAIAPELFSRQGDARGYTDTAKLMAEVIAKVPDAQVMQDLDAVCAWAVTSEGGDKERVGITGFCWGGRITWLWSAHAKIKAGVAWYGRLVGQASDLQPKHPVDLAGGLRAPVLGLYGGKDAGIPLDTVDKMKAALAAGGSAAKLSEFVVYPEAPHAFHADYRPSFRPETARDGWQRCLAWFKKHGVA